jgi:hypothetical protein
MEEWTVYLNVQFLLASSHTYVETFERKQALISSSKTFLLMLRLILLFQIVTGDEDISCAICTKCMKR